MLHRILYVDNILFSSVLYELNLLLESFEGKVYHVSSPLNTVLVSDVVIVVVVVVVVVVVIVVVVTVVVVVIVVVIVVVNVIVFAFLSKTIAVGVTITAMSATMIMIEIIIHHNLFFPTNLFL